MFIKKKKEKDVAKLKQYNIVVYAEWERERRLRIKINDDV